MLKEAISKMPTVFDPKMLLRGQDYFHKGNVLNIRLSDGLLKGRVKGGSSHIYDIHMDLKKWPSQSARCSCPVQTNCKHAAACLFALRDREYSEHHLKNPEKLDKKLDIWLKNLRVQEETQVKKQEMTHELHYIINLNTEHFPHHVSIDLALTKLLKRGGFGKRAVLNSMPDSKKEHLNHDDNDIVAQLLFKCDAYGWFNHLTIRNSDLLTRIIATGRAFFDMTSNNPVTLGPSLNGECQWFLATNGNQHLLLTHGDTKITPLLLDNSWYFDMKESVMGTFHTSFPVKQLHYLLEAPPISLEQAIFLAKKMKDTCPEFPQPKVFKKRELMTIRPVPVAIFDAVSNFQSGTIWDNGDRATYYTVKIAFDYSGLRIAYHDASQSVVRTDGNMLLEYARDIDYEHAKLQELQQLINLRTLNYRESNAYRLKRSDVGFILEDVHTESDLAPLYNTLIPHLKNTGWSVEFASKLYQETISADDVEWYSDLHESGTDFFSYQLGILVNGQPVSIVPLVAELIQQYSGNDLDALPDTQLVKLPLKDGKALQLEMGRIKPLVRLLLQFGIRNINESNQLELSKFQLMLMQEIELAIAATKVRWQGAEQFRNKLKRLALLDDLPEIVPPEGLKINLRDYQHHGLQWLQFLRVSGFSGILADDMGLGKTVQTLAHILYEKEQGRVSHATLIIAPTSLVGNWLAESKRFTPELRVLVYHGSDRFHDNFDDYDIVISTYGLIHRDKDKFISYNFYYLILDEAQFIKNSRTKTTQVIQQLIASHRLCLTGTPMENHLGELWSLFHFLMPGLLGDIKQFRTWFRTPIEKYGDLERRHLLTNRVKPFMLRRTKNQVAKELPQKTEIIRSIEILGSQRDLYEAIRMSMEKKVRDAIAKQGMGKSHILLLDALLKLRQICCDPRLLSLPEATIAHGNSAKLDVLMELLNNLVEEDRRVLIFSQFTSMLQLIEEQIQLKQYQYVKLTGQTQNRQAIVDRFQEGNIPIFLISLKAGGTGLNLTRADTVIHYDPWWNPAVEDQATDRTHRIGQENPVFVYKLITAGTVEEAILEMQQRKRALVDGILSQDASEARSLTEKDLDQFFTPLGT